MKRIHWKASAHSGKLFTKIYDPVLEAGATVALDFRRESWEAAKAREIEYEKAPPETAIEIACSICRYLSDGGWKLKFLLSPLRRSGESKNRVASRRPGC